MQWNQWYSFRSYIRSTLWTVPFVALLMYIVVIQTFDWIKEEFVAVSLWPWSSPSGAQVVLQTIVTLTLTFIVFTFGSLLVAIQVASGQLTPRIIATALLRDNVIRVTVGLFIFTLLFATGVLGRIEEEARYFLIGIAGILGYCSIVAFLFLIDHAARLLRPVSIVKRIGDLGNGVIEQVYPDSFDSRDVRHETQLNLVPDRTILHHGESAIVLAVNLKALVSEARRFGIVIELAQRVGSFVASDEPLFRLYGDAGKIEERRLVRNIAFGPERTIEQDSAFAFRIIVDVGIKALSKAINDPTTAVVAIDQLHRLLRKVGCRRLHGDEVVDGSGQLRLIFRTPDWDDFVQLAIREIRFYGAENFQVARRLRAMIENLIQTLPDERQPALRTELDLLDRALKSIHVMSEDLALASVSDLQGLGAAS